MTAIAALLEEPEAPECNFTFEIISPTHGRHTVTAPARFRAEIEARTWHVCRSKKRDVAHPFFAQAHVHLDRNAYDKISLHALVWQLAGHPPVAMIDHVDRDPLNNAEDNLRDGSIGNQWNRTTPKNNSSGVKGVRLDKRRGRWVAEICVRGSTKYLGAFDNKDDAARARADATRLYHGNFGVI